MSSSKKKAAASSLDIVQDASQADTSNASTETAETEMAASQPLNESEGAEPSDATKPSSQQPIPPPSEPKQFRAIGLLQGVYVPSEEQFNRGELITREGLRLDAVLLGQVMSLVKKYLDLSLPHLWVVYPRTRDAEPMHVQLVGVWAPEGFETQEAENEADLIQSSLSPLESLTPPLKDGFFSIRGQVIQQDVENNTLFVKIQQASRKKKQTSKAFKVKLSGEIPQKPMGYFWDFEVVREGDFLKIEKATPVAFMPLKKKKGGPPNRRPSKPGAPKKVIKKSVPLGTEHGKPEPKYTAATPKKKTPAPSSRPLPKIIRKDEE